MEAQRHGGENRAANAPLLFLIRFKALPDEQRRQMRSYRLELIES